MTERIETDICVIGAGSGGLTVAAGASQMGARTVLIERGRMGGDCLNYGCVPSKALLAAAHAAVAWRRADAFGIEAEAPRIDHARVYAHVARVIAGIAPHDSQERFEGLGVRVLRSSARFTGPTEVEAGGTTVRARRFVVATGSSPLVPPIPGLEDVPTLTNETIFEQSQFPRRLIVVGGGPVGVELAQAHRRLGAEVVLVELASLLPRDDPEAVEIVRRSLRADGVILREGTRVTAVTGNGAGVVAAVEKDGTAERIEGSHLLLAAGRKPTVDGLGLEAAGIEHGNRGIRVDDRLRTSNARVYAIGDVTGDLQFTHMAGYQAAVVLRNALFRLPARVDRRAVPWVTYTDPELAHVGIGEAAARAEGRPFRVLRWAFAENDRARAERQIEGHVKAIVSPRGRVLGATIVGRQAGELILPWVMAVRERMGVSRLASLIAPYPTLGEAGKRAAGSFYAERLFGEGTKRLVRMLLSLG